MQEESQQEQAPFVSREQGAKVRKTRKAAKPAHPGQQISAFQTAQVVTPEAQVERVGPLEAQKIVYPAPKTDPFVNPPAKPLMTVNDMITKVIETGNGMDQLERLIALKERMDLNVSRTVYLEAMSAMQGVLPKLKRNASVDQGTTRSGATGAKYKYADLDEIEEAIKGPMAQYGFSKKFEPAKVLASGDLEVTCIISHIGGHSERTTMQGPPDNTGGKNGIQSVGSSSTYLQRYTLIAALGLVTASKDDDGRSHGTGEKPPPTKSTLEKKDLPPISNDLLGKAILRASKGEEGIIENLKQHYTITDDQEENITAIYKAHKKGG